MNVWLDTATIAIAIIVMFSMNIKLTFVALLILPIYVVAVKYFFGRLRKLTKERSQALATMQGYLHERIQGMQVTRSFALEEYEGKQFEKEIMNFDESVNAYELDRENIFGGKYVNRFRTITCNRFCSI